MKENNSDVVMHALSVGNYVINVKICPHVNTKKDKPKREESVSFVARKQTGIRHNFLNPEAKECIQPKSHQPESLRGSLANIRVNKVETYRWIRDIPP